MYIFLFYDDPDEGHTWSQHLDPLTGQDVALTPGPSVSAPGPCVCGTYCTISTSWPLSAAIQSTEHVESTAFATFIRHVFDKKQLYKLQCWAFWWFLPIWMTNKIYSHSVVWRVITSYTDAEYTSWLAVCRSFCWVFEGSLWQRHRQQLPLHHYQFSNVGLI